MSGDLKIKTNRNRTAILAQTTELLDKISNLRGDVSQFGGRQ